MILAAILALMAEPPSTDGFKPMAPKDLTLSRLMFMCGPPGKIEGMVELRHDEKGDYIQLKTEPVERPDFRAPIASAAYKEFADAVVVRIRSQSEPEVATLSFEMRLPSNELEGITATVQWVGKKSLSTQCLKFPTPQEPAQ